MISRESGKRLHLSFRKAKEGNILHNHGLHGGGLILLHPPRETRESREDEQSGDCEIALQIAHYQE